MIKQSKKIIVKKVVGKFVSSMLICSLAYSTQAQSVEKLNSTTNTADVKYLGISNGLFLFDVRYDNPKAEKFMFEITESSNNNLFKEAGRDTLFVKRFKVPTDLGELKFIIHNLKDNTSQTFVVNKNQRIYEDVVVKEIH